MANGWNFQQVQLRVLKTQFSLKNFERLENGKSSILQSFRRLLKRLEFKIQRNPHIDQTICFKLFE